MLVSDAVNKFMKQIYFFFVLNVFAMHYVVAKDDVHWVKEKIEQMHVGNFALPTSQQPAPLIAFGQNILDKGELLLFNVNSV
jgi:hypothetical protein